MKGQHYGPEARLDRDYESLTAKQRNVVDAIIEEDVDTADINIAEGRNFTPSYVGYVRKRFPHIISERRGVQQVATDGGEARITLELTESETWQAIQLVGDELSQKIYRQARRQ